MMAAKREAEVIRVSCLFQSCFFKGSAFVEDGFTLLLLYNSQDIQVCRFSALNALKRTVCLVLNHVL